MVPLACEDAGEAIEVIEVMVEVHLDLFTEVDEVMIIVLVVEDNRSLEETASKNIGSSAVHEGKSVVGDSAITLVYGHEPASIPSQATIDPAAKRYPDGVSLTGR